MQRGRHFLIMLVASLLVAVAVSFFSTRVQADEPNWTIGSGRVGTMFHYFLNGKIDSSQMRSYLLSTAPNGDFALLEALRSIDHHQDHLLKESPIRFSYALDWVAEIAGRSNALLSPIRAEVVGILESMIHTLNASPEQVASQHFERIAIIYDKLNLWSRRNLWLLTEGLIHSADPITSYRRLMGIASELTVQDEIYFSERIRILDKPTLLQLVSLYHIADLRPAELETLISSLSRHFAQKIHEKVTAKQRVPITSAEPLDILLNQTFDNIRLRWLQHEPKVQAAFRNAEAKLSGPVLSNTTHEYQKLFFELVQAGHAHLLLAEQIESHAERLVERGKLLVFPARDLSSQKPAAAQSAQVITVNFSQSGKCSIIH